MCLSPVIPVINAHDPKGEYGQLSFQMVRILRPRGTSDPLATQRPQRSIRSANQFRRPHPDANDVHVTGTFDDWGKTEQLNKVGDIWEKEVQLPKADEKILYKFVVNDNWVIDTEAPHEDDGHGNVNNVLLPENIKTNASAVTTSSAAPGSTTAALAGAVPLEPRKEATEGKL